MEVQLLATVFYLGWSLEFKVSPISYPWKARQFLLPGGVRIKWDRGWEER